jgi:hypothetical protein
MQAALGDEPSVDRYAKEDAEHALTTLEGEIVTPTAQQDSGRVAHTLQTLKAYGPTLVSLAVQIEALINNRPRF